MATHPHLTLVNQFYKAYNACDTKAIGELVSEDVHFEHHNRVKGQGKEKLLELVQMVIKTCPDRYFAEVTRWAVNGDFIFVEHTAYGTPVADLEAFGWKVGVPITMDCTSLMVVKDGKIVEWSDYA